MAKKGAEKNGSTTVNQNSSFNISKLLILGLLFHVIFIGSVFDCYFTSPVVNGMKSFNVGSAHAKRLVLIVDATALDLWALDHLEQLFQNATQDAKLNAELRQDKVVVFLHLLGLDTTGHSYRPHSKEYMRNIQVVDDIVQRTEKLFNEFYQDQDTSFVFTADHGMSEIGNHGDGHPDNTRTPLIAWGKGVRGPLPDIPAGTHDTYSEPWGLKHLYRRDVEQADIASLMAALIGIDWPVNSVGVLPDADPSRPGYLDPAAGEDVAAKSALINAKVILEQYRVKHELKMQHTLLYKAYTPLHNSESNDLPGEAALKTIESLIEKGQWASAKRGASVLIRTGLQGLHYLQTYDRFLIRTIVTFAYIGWACFASMYIFRPIETGRRLYRFVVSLFAAAVLAVFWGTFALQQSPWTFYLYVSFPVYFWQQFLTRGAPDMVSRVMRQGSSRLLVWFVFVVASTQAMVVGYTHRSIWSAGFGLMGLVWPLTWPLPLKNHLKLYGSWSLLCALNATFPLLSVNKTENVPAILAGGAVVILLGLVGLREVYAEIRTAERRRSIVKAFVFQVGLAPVTAFNFVD
ncbi:hypothetical protein EST38_g10459 [Candolleomyces aberdarensis]|uniref:GPI ethanolamine phosphate transferase 1 n=1 Tax=Candolleomyces aberdarensis TaxID=2316362 RepID=A0A4Q2D9S0_9AGAR|nr:hypothetical protein EST38_g10459 [Candolleomyces aberdarensis]